jgi:membrane protease YdiL (CAAX protease family)
MTHWLQQPAVHVALKVAVFAILGMLGMMVFGTLLAPAIGPLAGSALSIFAAAAVANTLAMRIYEQRGLTDIGFAWNTPSLRHLLLGLAGGAGGASVVLGGPLLAGAAELVESPDGAAAAGSVLFVVLVLLLGGIGEEMLFHGYGFQLLLATAGPWPTILAVSALFAAAHAGNVNVTQLALANTAGWGLLLGYAFWRSGDLWLPIGLHVGWNWTLPVFGVNLSGFTMNITGHVMHWKIEPLWSGGAYGPEGGLLTSAILVALFLGIRKAPIQRQIPFLLRVRWGGVDA